MLSEAEQLSEYMKFSSQVMTKPLPFPIQQLQKLFLPKVLLTQLFISADAAQVFMIWETSFPSNICCITMTVSIKGYGHFSLLFIICIRANLHNLTAIIFSKLHLITLMPFYIADLTHTRSCRTHYQLV